LQFTILFEKNSNNHIKTAGFFEVFEISRTGGSYIFFPQIPKTDGYYRNQIPDPTTGLDWWVPGSLSGCKYDLRGLYFWKRTPCYEVHCTQAPNFGLSKFQLSSGKTNCFKFYLFIYLFGVVRGHGEENVTQRWGSRGAFAFSSGTIAGELLK
jgi:hypothetical protein